MLYLIQFGFVILHLGHVGTKLQRFPSSLPEDCLSWAQGCACLISLRKVDFCSMVVAIGCEKVGERSEQSSHG